MFKVATWNVNSVRMRLPHILRWLKTHRPNILAIQETKVPDDKFPKDEIEAAGYHVIYSGQKSYNGVATISLKEATDVVYDLPGLKDPQRRVLGATIDGYRFLNLYVPNGTSIDSDKYQYKLEWLKKLCAHAKLQLQRFSKFVIVGDFNIAPADLDVYNPKAWEGQVLVSEPERAALQKILAVGLHDAYRLLDQTSGGYSWWDYRHAAFMRDMGLRLELILLSDELSKHCKGCFVDKTPRGWDSPSDHAPVIAEFD